MNSFGGTWNNQQCFDYEMRNGIHLDNPSFVNMYDDVVNEITTLLDIKTHTDLGGGVGAYSKAMRDIGKEVHYYDANIHHHEYASERRAANRYHFGDFTNMKITGDLVAMIEVAEHIADEKLIPFLTRVECNYFHFSSTPLTNKMDADWGHINIKQEPEWIELFESCGFKFLQKVQYPTYWSLLFTK